MDSDSQIMDSQIMVELLTDHTKDSSAKRLQNIYRNAIEIIEGMSSSEDSEFECEEHVKCKDFVGTIDSYSNADFKSHMRLQRNTVDYLIERYSQYKISNVVTSYSKTLTNKCTVYMYIWYISNTNTFRELGNLFGVTKSTAWTEVRRVTAFLISIGHEFIVWPRGAAAEEIQRRFELQKKIPGIIGVIDCTHITIKAPTTAKEDYFDRKRNYSLVLQAVVGADKQFTSVYCGESGSLHDFRVLRRSKLYREVEIQYAALFPGSSFLLADSAYPANSWLVPPFKNYGTLTDRHRQFNKMHSSTRIVVENAFGLLKGRFRRLLKFTEHSDLKSVANLIVSACVLHNICVIKDDLCDELELQDTEYENYEYLNEETDTTENRRDVLFAYLQDSNII